MSNNDRIFELITGLRAEMRDEFSGIKADISGIKSDITTLKNNVNVLFKRVDDLSSTVATLSSTVATLSSTVSTLSSSVATISSNLSTLATDFVIYTRQNTVIQENTNEEHLRELLDKRVPSSTFIKAIRYTVTPPTGASNLTELDGCILMNPIINDTTITNRILPGFTKDISDTIVESGKYVQRLTLLVESKHSMNIPKLNMKLRHAIEFENILKSIDTIDMSTARPAFKAMVDDNNMRCYPKTVNMVFASDDITYEMKEFIKDIYDGTITEASYAGHIIANLVGDPFYRALMKDESISNSNRNKLRDLVKAKNITEIHARCIARTYGRRSNDLLEYVQLFSEIMPALYSPMKEKICILQFDKLTMPHLVNMANNSGPVGWTAVGGVDAPKTRKSRQPKK